MNMYYELSECVVGGKAIGYPGRYFAAYGLEEVPNREVTKYLGLMANSDRAWKEFDDGRVVYVKNKTYNQDDQVDMKEFFWVKLKCQAV